MVLFLAGVITAALAVQLVALQGMGARRPVGDEQEYLDRGRSEDPHAPRLFLRPPLLPWLARLFLNRPEAEAGERRLRRLMAAVSVAAVALTAVAGWRLGGPALALLATFLLAVQPERILFGCHLWPDTLLAAALAALAVILTLPAAPAVALAAGVVATAGVLIRIDFLAALPLLVAAWSRSEGSLTALTAASLIAPPLVALAVVSLRNARRYGIPLPDNTWAFNLMVVRSEILLGGQHRVGIEGVIADTLVRWRGLSAPEASRRGLAMLGEALRSPWRLAQGIARRLLTVLGPDTFVRQKLLPRGAAYPELGDAPRRRWDAALKAGFPLLVTAALSAAAANGRIPGSYAWPTLGLLAVAVLFHARTRYRVVALPALSLFAAQEILRFQDTFAGRLPAAALTFAGGLLLFLALLRIRCSAEQ